MRDTAAAGDAMAGFLQRGALLAAGVVLGMALVAGAGLWRARSPRPPGVAPPATPAPPAGARTVAPDTRA